MLQTMKPLEQSCIFLQFFLAERLAIIIMCIYQNLIGKFHRQFIHMYVNAHPHAHTHNVWSKHELLLDERGWDNIEILITISTLTVLWCESSFSVARPNFQSPNRTQRSQSSHVWNGFGFSLSFADICVNVCAQATSKRLSVIKCIEPR